MPSKNESEQLNKIFSIFGTPNDENWPKWKELKFARNMNFKKIPGLGLENKIPKGVISDQGLNLMK